MPLICTRPNGHDGAHGDAWGAQWAEVAEPDSPEPMSWEEFDRAEAAVRETAEQWGLCPRCCWTTPVNRYGKFTAHKREKLADVFEVCPGTGAEAGDWLSRPAAERRERSDPKSTKPDIDGRLSRRSS